MKYFWYGIINGAFLVLGLSIGGVLCSRHFPVQPPVVITAAEVVQQAIFPIPPGRRRPIEEQLSPEMRHKIMVWKILQGMTNNHILAGPEGLDAPWKREK
jgi:hypothetical protein